MKASTSPPPTSAAAPPSRNLSTYDPSSSDGFIRFIAGLLRHSFVLADSFAESVTGTMSMVETLVAEHLSKSEGSRLQRLVPSIGRMHTPLALVEAFGVYDAKYALTRRTHVPPSEDEVRHILNLAQIFSSAAGLQFISFDGDETLYADGKNFAQSDAQKLARYIEKLLSSGIGVALVTAAGYKGAPEKYETRLDGLLHYLAVHKVTDTALERFFVVGGECNYLFEAVRVSAEVAAADGRGEVRLREAADGWNEEAGWDEAEASAASLRATARELGLRCNVVRKERAVGIIPGGAAAKSRVPNGSGSRRMRREVLDEAALRLQEELKQADVRLPTCCFNGGSDVWCDLGNKAIGVLQLQRRLGVRSSQCLHVGDQFSTSIGNDYAARLHTPTLWVAGPKETQHVLKQLLERRGISAKTPKKAAWPPSTVRFSVFDAQRSRGAEEAGEGNAEEAGEGNAEAEPSWVRG